MSTKMEAQHISVKLTNDIQNYNHNSEVDTTEQVNENLVQLKAKEHQFTKVKQDTISLKPKTRKQKPPQLQAKLKIGAPNDRYEQEADRMADFVVRNINNPSLQTKPKKKKASPLIQRKCHTCQGEQTAPDPITQKLQQKKGHGNSLPPQLQSQMEQGFGVDFSGVRIHTDNDSIQMNQQLGARAFTHGSDVYFNRGEFQPSSMEGQRLLAHELTHVVQQEGTFPMIQKVEPVTTTTAATTITIGTVLSWCLSGAATSIIIDQIIQGLGWAWEKINTGNWNLKQNWCKTFISGILGCVFGMVGGAMARMIFREIARFTVSQLAKWIKQKLIVAGLTQLAGRWGQFIAKAGCNENKEKVYIPPPPSV